MFKNCFSERTGSIHPGWPSLHWQQSDRKQHPTGWPGSQNYLCKITWWGWTCCYDLFFPGNMQTQRNKLSALAQRYPHQASGLPRQQASWAAAFCWKILKIIFIGCLWPKGYIISSLSWWYSKKVSGSSPSFATSRRLSMSSYSHGFLWLLAICKARVVLPTYRAPSITTAGASLSFFSISCKSSLCISMTQS